MKFEIYLDLLPELAYLFRSIYANNTYNDFKFTIIYKI